MRKRNNRTQIIATALTLMLCLIYADRAFAAEQRTGFAVTADVARLNPAPVAQDQITATAAITVGQTITELMPVTTAAEITTTTAITTESADDVEVADTANTVDAAQTPPDEASEQESDAATTIDESQYTEILSGTILANRTDVPVRFFVEGQTYLLDPLRSIGLDLPRVSAVLNLFNCDAFTPESEEECYWDPYLLDKDSFYEVVEGGNAGGLVTVTLREAGSPEAGEIWIQNRTGKSEVVVYRNVTYELPPAAVEEFSLDADDLPTFFLRSCVAVGGESICEWLPVVAEAGIYYGLMEVETAGGLSGSTLSSLELRAVLEDDEPLVETPPQLLCRLQVPAMNVRSGPGLEYQIVAKVRGTEETPATVLVNGRDAVADWLAVDVRVADGGWIAGNPSYVLCDGDLMMLPETEITDGRLAPTPAPAPLVEEPGAESDDQATAADADESDTEESTSADDAAVEIPEGLALVTVNNAFDHEIRFTMDQVHRVEIGPSEIDLQPGESADVLVYPGFIAFSASSPWSGLSGNADFYLDADQSQTLWLLFAPDPDGSGRWIMLY